MFDLPTQILVDSHISLHVLEEKDGPKLFRLVDRNRARLKQWLPWLDATQSVADSLKFIQDCEKLFHEKKALHLGVFFRGQLAGVIGLHQIDWINSKTSIGYWLGAEFEGRGIMVRSCRSLLDTLFKELKMNRVEIWMDPKNRKSRAIPHKLGFIEEGTLREYAKFYNDYVNHTVHAMLRKDWK